MKPQGLIGPGLSAGLIAGGPGRQGLLQAPVRLGFSFLGLGQVGATAGANRRGAQPGAAQGTARHDQVSR